jgi:hypothetical protein
MRKLFHRTTLKAIMNAASLKRSVPEVFDTSRRDRPSADWYF